MYEYLNDMDFLMQLDKLNIRTHYAKITLLSFDEKPIREIQGNITAGSLSVNGSSAVRRTISLTMLADYSNNNLEDIDNEISINKKVKIMVGYKNPMRSYSHYGEIIWFPCGLFILSTATVSRSTNGWTISISGKDKMCLLDGTVGGTLPQSISFHESEIWNKDGSKTVVKPTIYKIIYEAVNHWGGEAIENIIISDLEEKTRELVRYIGDKPIYFSEKYESMSFSADPDFPHKKEYGDDAGYKETDFIYPGELILNAGDTVVTLLDRITDLLGNFEFFYDIDGHFIFQEIKNYLNTGSPLEELQLPKLNVDNYVKNYNNAKFLYSLTSLDSTTTITKSPRFDNVKNDFYAWGSRETATGKEHFIRYHLAIDKKPDIALANKYMWKITNKDGFIVRYDFTENDMPWGRITGEYSIEAEDHSFDTGINCIKANHGGTFTQGDIFVVTFTDIKTKYWYSYIGDYNKEEWQRIQLVSTPCGEWREELYRRALDAQVTNSVYDNSYDAELISEWRYLYDPMKESWKKYNHWNPDVMFTPRNINFWLDFIDTSSEIGKYSVKQIGRRTKVVNNKDIKSVYNMEAPDIIFVEGLNQTLIAQYEDIRQKFFVLTPEYYDLFATSTNGASCFDKVREMMYQNLNYNTTITLTCLPKYYMEPNNIIHVEDKKSNINGNYQITQFTLPLAYNGTMSITATEVLTRI